MSKGVRKLMLLALVGVFVLGLASAALAAVGDLPFDMTGQNGPAIEEPGFQFGDPTPVEPTETILDLPALEFVRDANGRICMDLPALDACSAPQPAPAAAPAPKKLPKTGANVGDILSIGMAALAGGGVAIRRLKLALAR